MGELHNTGNLRMDALLNTAADYGYTATKSVVREGVWLVTGDRDNPKRRMLVLHGGPNHAVQVFLHDRNSKSSTRRKRITQRDAGLLLSDRGL